MNHPMRRFSVLFVLAAAALSAPAQSQTEEQREGPPPSIDVNLPPLTAVAIDTNNVIVAPLGRGEAERAVELAQTLIERANDSGQLDELPHLYFQLAQARWESGRPFAAALDFLRVVIHYPDHAARLDAMERAAHTLYQARLDVASKKLLRRALDETDDAAMKTRLTAALDAIGSENAP